MTQGQDQSGRSDQLAIPKGFTRAFIFTLEAKKERVRQAREGAERFRAREEFPARFDAWKQNLAQKMNVDATNLRVLPINETYEIDDISMETYDKAEQGTVDGYRFVVPFTQRERVAEILHRCNHLIAEQDVILTCEGAHEFGALIVDKNTVANSTVAIINNREQAVGILGERGRTGVIVAYDMDNGMPHQLRRPGYAFRTYGTWVAIFRRVNDGILAEKRLLRQPPEGVEIRGDSK